MSHIPEEMLSELDNNPLPIQAPPLTESWKWTRSELLNGALQTAYCNACSGTGLIEQSRTNITCPWCRGWIDLKYQASGGIRDWELARLPVITDG